MHRDAIRVFYKNPELARKDGYKFEDGMFSEKGYVYPYTGLRGDAKHLYGEVSKGKEKRVQLIEAGSPHMQRVYVLWADLVIWACGY